MCLVLANTTIRCLFFILIGKNYFLDQIHFRNNDLHYDCYRTPDEWIKMGDIEDVRYPIPAIVYVESSTQGPNLDMEYSEKYVDQLFKWCYAAVISYSIKDRLWDVLTLDGFKKTFRIPRIYICFIAEDPRVFVERIQVAINARNQAEGCIR